MYDKVLTEEHGEALHGMISNILGRSGAESVFVCDKGGNIIDHTAHKEDECDVTVAALASGSFAATHELAKLVGEQRFRSVYHRGENMSMYMQNLGKNYLILVLFSSKATVGMVKLCIEMATKNLELLLGEVSNQTVASSGVRVSFSLSESDPVFNKKA